MGEVAGMGNNAEDKVSKFYSSVGWETEGKLQRMQEDGKT